MPSVCRPLWACFASSHRLPVCPTIIIPKRVRLARVRCRCREYNKKPKQNGRSTSLIRYSWYHILGHCIWVHTNIRLPTKIQESKYSNTASTSTRPQNTATQTHHEKTKKTKIRTTTKLAAHKGEVTWCGFFIMAIISRCTRFARSRFTAPSPPTPGLLVPLELPTPRLPPAVSSTTASAGPRVASAATRGLCKHDSQQRHVDADYQAYARHYFPFGYFKSNDAMMPRRHNLNTSKIYEAS